LTNAFTRALIGAKMGRGVRVSPDALKAYVAKVLK
jgi:hypothetical protein